MKGSISLKRKVQKLGDSVCVVIPSQLAQLKGLKAGVHVNISVNEKGEIILKKV